MKWILQGVKSQDISSLWYLEQFLIFWYLSTKCIGLQDWLTIINVSGIWSFQFFGPQYILRLDSPANFQFLIGPGVVIIRAAICRHQWSMRGMRGVCGPFYRLWGLICELFRTIIITKWSLVKISATCWWYCSWRMKNLEARFITTVHYLWQLRDGIIL